MSKETENKRFKIEFSDVRLTPEQLKNVEDKIEDLESQLIESKLYKKRMIQFLMKLSNIISIQEHDLKQITSNGVDYEILISQGVTDNPKMFFKYKN
jgi:hypothetical protein